MSYILFPIYFFISSLAMFNKMYSYFCNVSVPKEPWYSFIYQIFRPNYIFIYLAIFIFIWLIIHQKNCKNSTREIREVYIFPYGVRPDVNINQIKNDYKAFTRYADAVDKFLLRELVAQKQKK